MTYWAAFAAKNLHWQIWQRSFSRVLHTIVNSNLASMHDRGREGHRLTLTTWDTEVGRLAADRDEVCQDKLELEIKYWTLVFYDSLISSVVRSSPHRCVQLEEDGDKLDPEGVPLRHHQKLL